METITESVTNVLNAVDPNLHLASAMLTGGCFALLYKLTRVKRHTGFKRSITWANDVTEMNKQHVKGIIQVMSEKDVKDIVKRAINEKVKIIARGTQHSMGGHCIEKNGYIIDTTFMNRVLNFDEKTGLITIQPGITWSDVIKFLNNYGRSPSTLQSYSSFAAGGTGSFNAHGITNDDPMIKSIVSIRLVMANGEVVTCSRDENSDIFKHAIGGCGLFGIITEMTLKTVPNTKLHMESEHLSVPDFFEKYTKLLKDSSVGVKLGRIDIMNMNRISLYTFRNEENTEFTKSDLDTNPHQMSKTSQLMYKWIIPMDMFQRLRFSIEQLTGKPLDWSGDSERNELLYETAQPMAKLYSPIIDLDMTHILQEYFIPHDKFIEWMTFMRLEFLRFKMKKVTLLNITIRYLNKDTESSLPYAKDNMFAFVMYYRMNRTLDEDKELETVHNILVNKALDLGGTFYLPYRFHYDRKQLEKAYPEIGDFFAAKQFYDPTELFSNMWYDEYGRHAYTTKINNALCDENFTPEKDIDQGSIENRNSDQHLAYIKMFNDPTMAGKFKEFLKHIFNVYPYEKLYKIVEDRMNSNGKKYTENMFRLVYDSISGLSDNLIITKGSFKSLTAQKRDIAGQVKRLLEKTYLDKDINGQVCIGDPGRYSKVLKDKLNIKRNTYIVHDREGWTDIIERGSIMNTGKKVTVDFNNIKALDIPDESVDLVTCFPGLHHMTSDNINVLMQEVTRVLRPNGRFMLREHNGHKNLVPLLVCAHNIFNAVTGVSYEDEKNEYREFRTIEEWRNLVEPYGFTDKRIYEIQENDPTEDYLMLFVKDKVPEITHKDIFESSEYKSSIQEPYQTYHTLPEWFSVDIVKKYWEFLNHTPWFDFPYIRTIMLFFKLINDETSYIRKRYGYRKAYLNSYFLMNTVISLVTSFVFLQLSVLAIIPSMMYTRDSNAPPEVRTAVVKGLDIDNCDKRINVLKNSGDYTLVEIPRYTVFNEIVMNLVKSDVVFNSIAGQKRIQIKVKASGDKDLESVIDGYPEYIIVTKYNVIPSEHTEYGIDVPVEKLLHCISLLEINDFEINHFFDF